MFHYAIFGATEGKIPSRAFSVVTLFGFSVLHQPTLAQRIQESAKARPKKRGLFDRLTRSDRGVIVTLFGACEIKTPTLMEEYTALRGLVQSETLSPDQLRLHLEGIDPRDEWVAITLFGFSTTSCVSRQKQIKALDAGERNGLISKHHRRQLDELIGAPAATAAGALGKLVAEPA